jgi:hypothetical protein
VRRCSKYKPEVEIPDCASTRGALCEKIARRDLRGGRQATDVPTLIAKKMSLQHIFSVFLFFSLHQVFADEKREVLVGGELENPGHFSLNEDSTLGDILSQKAKLLPLASTRRIEIHRSGTKIIYDLKLHSSIKLVSGDVIVVPARSWYEGQSLDQEHLLKITPKNPRQSFEKIKALKIKGVKVQYSAARRVEFRPASKEPQGVWSRVLVVLAYDLNDEGKRVAKDIFIYSRNWSSKVGRTPKLKYQIELEKQISEICSP